MPKNEWGAYYTDHINRRVVQSIFDAIGFAFEKGSPLNREVVINLHECDAKVAATIFEDIRARFRDWLNYRSKKDGAAARPAYVYTLEDSNEKRPHPHVNWLIHVPEAYAAEFCRKLPRWVLRSQGKVGPFDIHCEPIVADYVKRLAKYIVKGVDPLYVAHFHLNEMAAPQGRVWGRRAGVSPSLAQTARREAGFKRKKKHYPDWKPFRFSTNAAAPPRRPSWTGNSANRGTGRGVDKSNVGLW